jgi:hypothetical protein
MSSVHIYSKTVYQPGNSQSGFDLYQRDVEGGDTPSVLRREGIFTENGLSSWTEKAFNPSIKISFSGPSGPWSDSSMYSVGLKPIPEDSVSMPSVYDDLLPKLVTAWKESDFNVGVFAAEGKESIEMMVTRLRGLFQAARSLKRGNVGGALRNLTGRVPKSAQKRARARLDTGDVSGAYLEYHLGWAPMYRDLYEAAKALGLRNHENVVRASVKHVGAIRAAGQPNYEVVAKGKYHRILSAKCIVTREASTIERLGLTDPAGILWEATPFSFIVDYVLPIGRSLESMHAVAALPVKKIVLTTYDVFEGTVMPVSKDYLGGVYLSEVSLPAVSKTYHVERVVAGSIHDIISGWAFMPTSLTPKWDKGLKEIGILSSLVHQSLLSMPSGGRLSDFSLEDLPLPGGRR